MCEVEVMGMYSQGREALPPAWSDPTVVWARKMAAPIPT